MSTHEEQIEALKNRICIINGNNQRLMRFIMKLGHDLEFMVHNGNISKDLEAAGNGIIGWINDVRRTLEDEPDPSKSS